MTIDADYCPWKKYKSIDCDMRNRFGSNLRKVLKRLAHFLFVEGKEMNDEEYKAYLQSDGWKQKAEERMRIDNYRCQGCGSCGTAENPLEVHHLSYKNLGNEDLFTELVTCCHCCHKLIHKVMERQTNCDGRKGWKSNPRIPTVHVFNVSGFALEYKEEE